MPALQHKYFIYLRTRLWRQVDLTGCLLLIIYTLAIYLPIISNAQTDEETELHNLTRQYFAAYEQQDLKGLTALWTESSTDFLSNKESFQQIFAIDAKIVVKNLSVENITKNNSEAQVTVVVDLNIVDSKNGSASPKIARITRRLNYVKEKGNWKIRQYGLSENLINSLKAINTEEDLKALLAAEKEPITVEEQRMLVKETMPIFYNGNLSQAQTLIILNYAEKIAQQMGDKAGLANTLRNIGSVYGSTTDPTQALVCFEKSLAIAKELNNKSLILLAINNIGLIYYYQGNYVPALDFFQQSLAINEELKNNNNLIRISVNIANIYKEQGNYVQAFKAYQRCLVLGKQLKDQNVIVVTLNNIGVLYDIQGNYEQALDFYQQSLAISEEFNYSPEIARSLSNIGIIKAKQEDLTQAQSYFEKSLVIAKELKSKLLIASALNNIGRNYRAWGNYEQALNFYQQSLALCKEMKNGSLVARTLNNIGDIYARQGDHKQAQVCFQRVAEIAKQINTPDLLWLAYYNIGTTYNALNQPEQAKQAFNDSIDIIEKLLTQVTGGEQDLQRFFEEKTLPYYAMVDLLIGQNNYAEALKYAEQAKGRVLLGVLQNGRGSIAKAMTDEEQKQEQQLIDQLRSLNMKLTTQSQQPTPNKSDLEKLKVELEKTRREYESFQTNLYIAHPDLKLQRGQIQPIDLTQTSQLIPNEQTALLEYVVLENKLYLFVLTKAATNNVAQMPKRNRLAITRLKADQREAAISDPVNSSPSLKIYKLDLKKDDLSELVKQFHTKLETRDFDFKDTAKRLYDLLLKPAQEQLKNKTNLIIVPDGILWNLPFQALLSEQNRYLIQDSAISYATSLSVLLKQMELHAKRINTLSPSSVLLAFGNPALGKIANGTKDSLPLMDGELSPLPEAERQVKSLEKIYGPTKSRVYIGSAAREERAKAEAENFDILQFATHGILNNTSPMYSYLVMSQSQADSSEDGLLEAWELMKMDFKADLVVLSACQTAQGRISAGEGMIGISWALFVAGAPTTVVSQWKVASKSTTDLMIDFHQNLKKHMGKADALRQAMLRLSTNKEYNHPFYWAGFIVVGDAK